MLPEFFEPGISWVFVWLKFEVVTIKIFNVGTLNFDRNSTDKWVLDPLNNVRSVRPPITGRCQVLKEVVITEKWIIVISLLGAN